MPFLPALIHRNLGQKSLNNKKPNLLCLLLFASSYLVVAKQLHTCKGLSRVAHSMESQKIHEDCLYLLPALQVTAVSSFIPAFTPIISFHSTLEMSTSGKGGFTYWNQDLGDRWRQNVTCISRGLVAPFIYRLAWYRSELKFKILQNNKPTKKSCLCPLVKQNKTG